MDGFGDNQDYPTMINASGYTEPHGVFQMVV